MLWLVMKDLKPRAVEGVTPKYKNIISRQYSLNANVVVATRAKEPHSNAEYRLREYVLSEERQAVVKESGYVPIFD
jgi:ABC-type phosphate transport system substrate-binding protein